MRPPAIGAGSTLRTRTQSRSHTPVGRRTAAAASCDILDCTADRLRSVQDSLRAAIEGRAARLLAGRKDPAAIAELRALLASIEAAAAGG